MSKVKIYLGRMLLCWFMSISMSLIVGILFLNEVFLGEFPLVLYSLWFITLFVIPVTLLFYFYPLNKTGYVVLCVVLVALSYSVNTLPQPSFSHIIFIGEEDHEQNESVQQSDVKQEEGDLELPDEL